MPTEKTFTAAELAAATYAALDGRPVSPEAIAACERMTAHILHQRKHRPTGKQVEAFGALAADLLERDPADKGGWLFRSLSPKNFTGERIGHRPFMTVYRPMVGMMIDEVGGTRQYAENEFTGGKRLPTWQRAARFRATDWFRRWFADNGITRETWADHFQRERRVNATVSPLELRATKAGRFANQLPRRLTIDKSDPQVAAIIARMAKLNGYLSEQDIEPFGPVFLRRIFNNGDQPAYGWNEGGRLTALGNPSYQNVAKAERQGIAINGEEVVEIDIQANHLTLLVGLGCLPQTILHSDPYEVEGLPRSVVKQWVTMTLGHDKRHVRWPKEAEDDFLNKHGIALTTDYPLRATGDAILAKLPLLDEGGETPKAGWAELQYRESEIILSTMEALAYRHGVPSLPVHDSLIVPRSQVELAGRVLKQTYRDMTGVEPVLSLD